MDAGLHLQRMRALPYADLDAVLGAHPALILAPHADDESLGCGGMIAGACARGRPPLVAILTDGTGSHPGSTSHPPDRLRAVREQEAWAAVTILGLPPERLSFLRLRDTAAPHAGDVFEDAVAHLTRRVQDGHCGAVLAPWRHDPHCDHLAAHLMACAVTKRTGARHLSYPVWGWTLPADHPLPGEPERGMRLDISQWRDVKRRAIAAHRSQYSDLISDDPNGFRLPAALLSAFEQPFEVFLGEPA
jgi:LmbE family N-acetylglucosaminyl deacetylase